VALGLASSFAAALPVVLRGLPDVQPATALLAVAGAASLVVVPVGLWLRRALSAERPATDRALLLGAALSSLPLALFGGVLKSTTHHRPLGGATFAVAALCLLASCVALAFRLSVGVRNAPPKALWRNLFSLVCALSLGATLLLATAAAGRPHLLDFVVLAAAISATAFVKIPTRLERTKWPPVAVAWGLLLAAALLSIRAPEVARSLTAGAPVSFAPLSWLGGGS
jgi:hypothetical protein